MFFLNIHKKKKAFKMKILKAFLVESERIELSSKQAIEELSTRLFPDWIFDKKQGQKQPLFA